MACSRTRVELGDVTCVALGELGRALGRLAQQPLDTLRALALDQGLEVPFGRQQLGVGEVVGGRGHGRARLAASHQRPPVTDL
jgi:hypothetical protein